MTRFPILFAILAMFAITALADIPPRPGQTPNRVKKPAVVNTELDISLERDAKEARLIIPASQLKQLRAELEALDTGDPTAAGISDLGGGQRLQTIMTGSLLSLALILGGIWLWRSGANATRTRAVGAVVITAAVSAGAGYLYANAGPPNEARSITGKMFSQSMHIYGFGWGKIKLETGDGDRVKLVVPNPKTETKPGEE